MALEEEWEESWDVLISAFNGSERVEFVYQRVEARHKVWIIHEEYAFKEEEMPREEKFECKAVDEVEMLRFWEEWLLVRVEAGEAKSICIDATGFMRPQLLFLINLLKKKGVSTFDIIYAEPQYYRNKDNTVFAGSYVEDVKQVIGYEGQSDESGSREVLIIGAGYETNLILEVAEEKDQAKKLVVLGLPSLRPDMYQQNAWRAWRASDAVSRETSERHFAPAADIFGTATMISELIEKEKRKGDLNHIYLAPLSTKAQAVGFALCILCEYEDQNVSIIYPFTREYEKETSVGVARIWRHTIELRGNLLMS